MKTGNDTGLYDSDMGIDGFKKCRGVSKLPRGYSLSFSGDRRGEEDIEEDSVSIWDRGPALRLGAGRGVCFPKAMGEREVVVYGEKRDKSGCHR